MSDLRNDFEKIAAAAGRMSLIAQLGDKVAYAKEATHKECGRCIFWMTKSCPREKSGGLSGYSQGPSARDYGCSKHEFKPYVFDIQKERTAEAVAFAKEHDLPVPEYLQSMIKASAEPEQ